MLNREAFIYVMDSTGVKWIKLIHIYGGSFCKKTKLTSFCRSSVRIVAAPRLIYKGFKVKFFKKRQLVKHLIILGKYNQYHTNGFCYNQFSNSTIILKKKKFLKTHHLKGFLIWKNRIRRFFIFFKNFL